MQQALVTASSRSRTTLKQTGAIAVGLILAVAMLLLGWWQFSVFREAGDRAVQERISAPALELATVAPAGVRPGDAYGRTVRFSGHYVPDRQLLVPEPGQQEAYRVVTPFVQENGTAVAVVRGIHRGSPDTVPPPPDGNLVQEGVLMPSEPTDDRTLPDGQLSSVRISVLTQSWQWPLVAGFATLDAELSEGQQLAYSQVEMPREGGEFRNAAYAVQWWVFAAFAVWMGIRMARDFGREREAILIRQLTELEESGQEHSPPADHETAANHTTVDAGKQEM